MSIALSVCRAVAAGLLSGLCATASFAAPEDRPAPATAALSVSQTAPAATSPTVVTPAIAAVISKLQDPVFVSSFNKDDVASAVAFYGTRQDPLWTTPSGATDRGTALIGEIGKAAQWGLDAKAFPLPDMSVGMGSVDAQGAAEAQLTLAALTYARYAKGGRVRPLSISQMLDLTPPVRDPAAVLKDLEGSQDPAGYLVALHPKHEQFQRLRAELVKRLGPVTAPKPVDAALLVKLPADGATIKPGSLHPDIALLRKRLQQPAAFAGQETFFDEKLAAAVTAFQVEKGLKANGQINRRTRTALNREGESGDEPGAARDTQRLIVNMERWRWMPDDLGTSFVINNVPEFTTRMFKNGEVIFKEKIIVGMPEWPTPSFSAEMKTIVFNPSWGVPDGIKAKELQPRLRAAQGGGGFFDQLFGGNPNSGGAAVIKAYGFTAYRDGKPVNPNAVNWASADLRQYSFIQPPGAENPLGFVKFMFPNSHDVYMHDTTQRHLFAEARRPYSHGCIRVNDPMRFAEILLEQDKGWSRERASAARRSSETVSLDTHVWVHNVYLTMWIGDDGQVSNFGDVYGLDNRVSQAIGGRAVRSIETPVADVETSSIRDDGTLQPVTKKKKDVPAAKPAKQVVMPGSFAETMSGLLAN